MSIDTIHDQADRETAGRSPISVSDDPGPPSSPEVVIEARPGWRSVDLRELWERRDLLWFLTWRGIKARYAQSALGIGWAVAQPLVTMLTYAIIFGRVARIPIPGEFPYAIFAFCGIVPWTFFSNAVNQGSNSLVQNASMLGKIYLPRLALPLSTVLSRLVDLAIALTMLGLVLAAYGVTPRPEAVVVIPAMLLVLLAAALGISFWLSALAVQYRDVAYGLTFVVQIMQYLSPVIYASSMVPARYRPIFGLNPMVGVIDGFRACLLGPPFTYDPVLIGEAVVISTLLLIGGSLYFRRAERIFADVA